MRRHIVFFICLLCVACVPFVVSAQSDALSQNIGTAIAKGSCESAIGSNPAKIRVSIPIPQVTETVSCTDSSGKIITIHLAKDIGDYLAKFYTFFVGIVGILATVMVMYGGIRWILAAGNASRISGAKEVITSAIIGVVIAFSSYLLLFLLNPRLVNYDLLSSTMSRIQISNVSESAKSLSCLDLLPNAVKPSGVMGKLVKNGIECQISKNCTASTGEFNIEDAVCGDLVEVTSSPNNSVVRQQCVGNSCQKGSCFKDIERCVDGYLAGSINWAGSANIDKMTLLGICNDGSINADSGNWLTGGGIFGSDRLSLEIPGKFYAYGNSSHPIDLNIIKSLNRCLLADGFMGYAFAIEINDDTSIGPTTDDVFAIGNDGKAIGSEDPWEIPKDNWKNAKNRLFKITDFEEVVNGVPTPRTHPIRFDINIDRNQFPAR